LRQRQAELAHVSRVTTIGELATSIAHEVNQPLFGVVTNASASLRLLAGDSPDLVETREAMRAPKRKYSHLPGAGRGVARSERARFAEENPGIQNSEARSQEHTTGRA
jgi:hypothetical protein